MASGPIPTEVENFVLTVIDTVPHLEALLLLFQSPASSWTVQDLAARIYVSEKTAAAVLDDLARRTLIARVEQSPPTYRYISVSDEQTALLEKVVQAYRTHLVTLTRMIHSNASGSVRDFARAFKLKRED